MSTQGRRVYPREDGGLYLAEGDYGFDPRIGFWECRPPGCHAGTLRAHQVAEHEDGTITVSPSILIEDDGTGHGWHGFLQRGVWRSG